MVKPLPSNVDSLSVVPVIAREKDCLFVTGKKETVNFLSVNYLLQLVFLLQKGYLQKKGVNPDIEDCQEVKYVKDVSCVNHVISVKCVANVPTVAIDLPVGARLNKFWEKWASLGVSPKVVAVIRQGYILAFRFQPNLAQSS